MTMQSSETISAACDAAPSESLAFKCDDSLPPQSNSKEENADADASSEGSTDCDGIVPDVLLPIRFESEDEDEALDGTMDSFSSLFPRDEDEEDDEPMKLFPSLFPNGSRQYCLNFKKFPTAKKCPDAEAPAHEAVSPEWHAIGMRLGSVMAMAAEEEGCDSALASWASFAPPPGSAVSLLREGEAAAATKKGASSEKRQ